MAGRKIFVSFNSLKTPLQVKCVVLPQYEHRSDFLALRELLYKEIMLDNSIIALGGNEASRLEDVLILQYDDDYGDIIDVKHDVIFYHKQRDLVVKLRKHITRNAELPKIISCLLPCNGGKAAASERSCDGTPKYGESEATSSPNTSSSGGIFNVTKYFNEHLSSNDNLEKYEATSPTTSFSTCIVSDAATSLPLFEDIDNQSNEGESTESPLACSSGTNFEKKDAVSELISYAFVDGVKRTTLVQLDETESHATATLLTDDQIAARSLSDENDVVSSSDDVMSTDYISATDHGDAPSLNKSTKKQKRKAVKTRVSVAKRPAIPVSNIVNKSTDKDCNIERIRSEWSTVAGKSNNHHANLLVETSQSTKDELISLPNEGIEEFEINPKLAAAIKSNKLTLYTNQFLLVCAKHLLKINQGSVISKGLYKRYAKLIVTKYPSLKDSDLEEDFLSVKTKIIKAINNQRGIIKLKEIRKLQVSGGGAPNQVSVPHCNRNQPKKQSSTHFSQESQMDIAASNTEVLDAEKDFEERRLFVKRNHSLRTDEILEKISLYLEFPTVFADFLKMPNINESLFKVNFDELMSNLKRFYLAECCQNTASSIFSEGEKGVICFLLTINRLCSTKKGITSSAELFELAQINKRVEPSYKGVNASAVLFFDDHDYLQSMLIICGTAVQYKNVQVTKIWQAVLKLLSVYYIFDRNYPAIYGVLSVVERSCISQVLNTSITVEPKDSSTLKLFIRKFNAFIKKNR